MSNVGWTEWSKYVLIELERLNVDMKALDNRLDHIILDTTKTEIQKEAEITEIRKDIDIVQDTIRNIKKELKLAQESQISIAEVRGQLSVWVKVWLAILSFLVLATITKIWSTPSGLEVQPKDVLEFLRGSHPASKVPNGN